LPSLASLPSPRDLPFIHKIDIQQGNVLTQDMVGQLRKGMEKKQVQFIMGTPIILDTFNPMRWDYLYTYEHGGGHTERRRVTLVFDGDALDHVEGDIKPAEGELIVDLHQDRSVKVPGFKKRSLVTKIKEKLPFVEPEPEVVVDDNPDAPAVQSPEEHSEEELAAMFQIERPEPISPYANIQAAPGEGIIVPPNAPKVGRKKGFVQSFFESIGLGDDTGGADDAPEEDEDFNPRDPKYRDITNQDDV